MWKSKIFQEKTESFGYISEKTVIFHSNTEDLLSQLDKHLPKPEEAFEKII
jgi:hypothetical protein